MSFYYRSIIFTGTIAFVALCVVFLVGLFQWNFIIHFYGAIIVMIFSSVYVGLVVFKKQLLRRKK